MKSIWKIFLLPIVFAGVCSCTKFVTPEDLALNVLESFQNNDVEHAWEYIMYEEDYEDLFSKSELNLSMTI